MPGSRSVPDRYLQRLSRSTTPQVKRGYGTTRRKLLPRSWSGSRVEYNILPVELKQQLDEMRKKRREIELREEERKKKKQKEKED